MSFRRRFCRRNPLFFRHHRPYLNRMNNAKLPLAHGGPHMFPKRFTLPFLWFALAPAPALAQTAPDATVHVDITPAHQINSFDPDSALGSSLDVLSHRDIDRVHT